jgi:hypothetical protein
LGGFFVFLCRKERWREQALWEGLLVPVVCVAGLVGEFRVAGGFLTERVNFKFKYCPAIKA